MIFIQLSRFSGRVGILFLLLSFASLGVQADPLPHIYTPHLEDTFPQLADKYYHDPAAWPAIIQATNQAAVSDPRFAAIESPRVVRPGQQLVIPPVEQIELLVAAYKATHLVDNLVSDPEAAPLTAAWLAEFTAYVDQARRHFGIPGAALAMVQDNRIVLAQGLGERELGSDQPVTPETVFGIGSTTKAMTSMLAATLVDEGKLGWDQPVSQIWPAFSLSDPEVARHLALRDLFNMRSGVVRQDLAWSGVGLSAEEMMTSLAALEVKFPPGRVYQYNNQMFATGGYVAALAAGYPYGELGPGYADLLRQRVFEPVGMSSATLDLEAVQANPNHASPHDFTLEAQVRPTHFHADPGLAPAGAVNANVLDLARFLITQLNQGLNQTGRRVASAQNLAETRQPQVEIAPDFYYGMGWFVEETEGVTLIWHDGDVLGFKSLLVMVPAAKVGLALQTNRTISFGFAHSVRYHLLEALYGLDLKNDEELKAQWSDFIERGLPEIRAPLVKTVTPEEVAATIGQYTTGWRLERREDGVLQASRGPYQWRLWSAGGGKFIVDNGFGITSEVKFVTDGTGAVVMQIKLSNGEEGEFFRTGE